ncbi:COX15/CtaA family protein [Cellulomonas massiliensis]|uniref:COX15/CtaA family protein n=1 Tax=Cellulomonas massiliensis TaxID=1465811 RepID=UPI00031A967E|nr:COX15/CtaA family protein [Cellulomonas massiliensis]
MTAPLAEPAGTSTGSPAPAPPHAPGTGFARLRSRLAAPVVVANLVGQIAIVGTGGAVRLTGSGLGCSTWPQCEPGEFTPQFHAAMSIHPLIEFGNRTLTVVLGIIGVLVALLVTTEVRRSRGYRALGLVPVLGVAAQAVIGGLVVLLHLHPGWVGLHMLVSMALVAASSWLLVRTREGDGPTAWLVPPAVRRAAGALGAVLVVVLALGVVVTGAGPHSGDDEVGYRLAVDPWTFSKLHAWAVWAFVAVLVAALVLLRRAGERGRPWRAGLVLLAVTLAQGAVGYVQLFTGLPVGLVNLHMIGAATLAATTVWFVGALRTRSAVGASSR